MTRWLVQILALLPSILIACSDAPTRRLGGLCGSDADCGQDVCYNGTCLDPAADDDLDGLHNALEIELGTDPGNADSDDDGKGDQDELDATLANVDSDEDGLADALESAILDDDGDCLPNQVDPQNLVPDTHDIDQDGISDVCDTPEPPVLTGIDPLSPSSDPNPVLRGSGDPNTPVAIFSGASCDGTPLATGACAADGSFAIAVPVLDNAETRFALLSRNPADLVSACLPSSLAYVHDDISPLPPGFESIAPPSPSSDPSPRVTGTAEAGSRIELHADAACSETPLGTGEAADGAFSVLVTVPENADTTLHAVALDLAANRSECVVFTIYRHDDQPPEPPTAHPAPFTPESPSNTETNPILRGCAEEGATLDLYRAADCLGEPIATSTADLPDPDCASGAAFSSIVPASPNASTTFYVQARDLADNTSTCATLATWVHDDLPPGPPVMLASQIAAVPSPSNNPAPVVRFCADATSVVEAYVDPACTLASVAATSVSGSTVCDGLTGSDERSFSLAVDTPVTYYAQAIDLAGNRSDCAALLAYDFDDMAPSAPVMLASQISAVPNPSNNPAPIVRFCADAGSVVGVYIDPACALASVAATPVGGSTVCNGLTGFDERTFTLAVDTPVTYYAQAIDLAGNRSDCGALLVYRFDDIPPSAPLQLTAEATGATSFLLNWVASTDNVGVAAYTVFDRGLDVGTTAEMSFSHEALVPGADHCYQVKAVDQSGNMSGASNEVCTQVQLPSDFSIATNAFSTGGYYDGANYLIGLEYNMDGTENQINTHVGAQMISSSGAQIGSVIETSLHAIASSIAFDGTNYLMVWEDNGGLSPTNCNFSLYGQFISSTGVAVGSSFVIAMGIEFDGLNILSYGGGTYLVSYTKLINISQCEQSNNRYIAGRTIAPNGTMGTEFRISTNYGAKNSMTFDGTKFFVVWNEDSQDFEVKGRFVSPEGALGTEIVVNASTALSDNPISVAFDGTNLLVVWSDETGGNSSGKWELFGQFVSPAGARVGNVITIVSGASQRFGINVAFNGEDYLAVWVDHKNDVNNNGVCDAAEGTCWDLYGQFVSPTGALVGAEIAIDQGIGNQFGGAVGGNNGISLVVVSSGVTLGQNGITQGGDVYGTFLAP